MEKCVCQICVCGSHRCGGRFQSNVIGQIENIKLPCSENQASYRAYVNPQSADLIRPLQADWHYKPIRDRGSQNEQIDNDDRNKYSQSSSLEEAETPVFEVPTLPDPIPLAKETNPFNNDNATQAAPPIPPITHQRKEVPPELPPLSNNTTYNSSFIPPLPISQMPNYKENSYQKPEHPMNDETITMRDFPEWDLRQDLKAPNPRTGEVVYGGMKGELKMYNVPMEYMTTSREGYSLPPPNVGSFKFGLVNPEKNEISANTCAQSRCEHHSDPETNSANSAIFQTSYKRSFGAPCSKGSCVHKRPTRIDHDHCPAEYLNYEQPSRGFEYMGKCIGHYVFLDTNLRKISTSN